MLKPIIKKLTTFQKNATNKSFGNEICGFFKKKRKGIQNINLKRLKNSRGIDCENNFWMTKLIDQSNMTKSAINISLNCTRDSP